MGLDMYLRKHTYFYDRKGEIKITEPSGQVKAERVSWIVEEVGYWRKANAIHRWFVENVQEDKDDCGEYEVTTAQLRKLLDLVEQVQSNPDMAPELLPTHDGFFFGGTAYGDDYKQNLELTAGIIKAALQEVTVDEVLHTLDPSGTGKGYFTSFMYHSSW